MIAFPIIYSLGFTVNAYLLNKNFTRILPLILEKLDALDENELEKIDINAYNKMYNDVKNMNCYTNLFWFTTLWPITLPINICLYLTPLTFDVKINSNERKISLEIKNN